MTVLSVSFRSPGCIPKFNREVRRLRRMPVRSLMTTGIRFARGADDTAPRSPAQRLQQRSVPRLPLSTAPRREERAIGPGPLPTDEASQVSPCLWTHDASVT